MCGLTVSASELASASEDKDNRSARRAAIPTWRRRQPEQLRPLTWVHGVDKVLQQLRVGVVALARVVRLVEHEQAERGQLGWFGWCVVCGRARVAR